MMKELFIILLLLIMIVSGCITQTKPLEKDEVISVCMDECKARLAKGEDLSNGPCLLNPVENHSDWVCDVAHSPRETVDNLPENQCSAFREGRSHHFVEVTPECQFIKAW